MTDLFKKNDRVLAYGKTLGTVYQDQHEGDAVVHVELDSQKGSVSGYYPSNLEKVPANTHISVLVLDDVPQGLIDLLSGNPWRNIGTTTDGPIIDVDTTLDKKAEPFTHAGSIKDGITTEEVLRSNGAEEKFLYKEGDRVKLKYNKNTGTVVRDQTDPLKTVLVHWDKAKPFDKSTDEKGGRELWEYPRNLTVLHAPRATDPANPEQELIDQLEALRLPIKARVERDQAILSKLTAAQKILKRQ